MATIYRAYANGEEITGFPINGVETKEIWGGDTLLWEKSGGIRKNIAEYAAFDKCTTTSGATLVNLISKNYRGNANPGNEFALFIGGSSIIKVINSFDDWHAQGFAIAYKNNFYIIHQFPQKLDFFKYSDKGELIFQYSNLDSIENMFFQGFYVDDDDTFYCIFYNKKTSSSSVPDTSLPPTVLGYKNGERVYAAEIEKTGCNSASTDYISNQYKIFRETFLESNRFLSPYYEYPFKQTLLKVETDRLSSFTIEDTFNSRYYDSYVSLGEYKGFIYLTGRYDYNSYGSFVCKYDGENYSSVYAAWEDTNVSLDWRNWGMRIQIPCAFYANNMYFISAPDSNSEYPYGVYKLNLTTRETPKLIYEMDKNEKVKRMYYDSEFSYTFLSVICLTVASGKLYVHKRFDIDNLHSSAYDNVYSIDEIPL